MLLSVDMVAHLQWLLCVYSCSGRLLGGWSSRSSSGRRVLVQVRYLLNSLTFVGSVPVPQNAGPELTVCPELLKDLNGFHALLDKQPQIVPFGNAQLSF